ncbi:SCP2 sterol-binding domain-containing protein [Crossiella sp. CA-258035]|uniref:SCP2 sterol-binding domain-containing protein n=1 Tax=Crossiella sp. CA-258035 TaxID=2981138 RepID=UPI0024BC3376|nr:SCP2 sterol-binding domain-containing protein [Crossiella sp. CA-258035]WHT19400.1 SCP2 sterol-binding domain-containing protein [Crossiella sp. CA-258035]
MTNSDPIAALSTVDPKKISKEEFVSLLSAASEVAGSGEAVDLSSIDPHSFARLISRASKDQIEAVMARPELRVRVLDEVFRRMEVHFKAEKAGSARAVVHWRIASGEDYERYETVIADGACSVNKENKAEPRVTVTLSPAEFLKLASGNGSAPVMFMTGKIKVKGDLGFAAGLSNLFSIPKA